MIKRYFLLLLVFLIRSKLMICSNMIENAQANNLFSNNFFSNNIQTNGLNVSGDLLVNNVLIDSSSLAALSNLTPVQIAALGTLTDLQINALASLTTSQINTLSQMSPAPYVAPQIGVPGLGGALGYISAYNTTTNSTLPQFGTIKFDNIVYQGAGIVYDLSTGSFIVAQSGLYLVSFAGRANATSGDIGATFGLANVATTATTPTLSDIYPDALAGGNTNNIFVTFTTIIFVDVTTKPILKFINVANFNAFIYDYWSYPGINVPAFKINITRIA